ncbi:hypothetical protein JCM1841_003230 [Sporobolomyces salmonicolor]
MLQPAMKGAACRSVLLRTHELTSSRSPYVRPTSLPTCTSLTPEQSQAEHDAASARHDALLQHRSAQGHDDVAHAHAVAASHVADPAHGAQRHLHAPDEQLAKAVEEK